MWVGIDVWGRNVHVGVAARVHVPYSTHYTPMGDALYSVTEEGGGRTICSFMQSNVV